MLLLLQVLLVTDSNPGIGHGSLQQLLSDMNRHGQTDKSKSKNPIPFVFPSELHVLLISSQAELQANNSLGLYQRLVDANGAGQVHTTGDGPLTLKSVQNMFTKYAESHYSMFNTTLQCGNLKSEVQLFPKPKTVMAETDTETFTKEIGSEIQVCGFLDMADIASPPILSRHLVIPVNLKGIEQISDQFSAN